MEQQASPTNYTQSLAWDITRLWRASTRSRCAKFKLDIWGLLGQRYFGGAMGGDWATPHLQLTLTTSWESFTHDPKNRTAKAAMQTLIIHLKTEYVPESYQTGDNVVENVPCWRRGII